MERRGVLAALVLLTALVCAYQTVTGLAQNQAQTTSTPSGQVWEYKTVGLRFGDFPAQQKVLNELGASGWELVAIYVHPHAITDDGAIIATLKRPKT